MLYGMMWFMPLVYAVYAVYAISSPDTGSPLRYRTQSTQPRRDTPAGCGLPLPPFSLVKETQEAVRG